MSAQATKRQATTPPAHPPTDEQSRSSSWYRISLFFDLHLDAKLLTPVPKPRDVHSYTTTYYILMCGGIERHVLATRPPNEPSTPRIHSPPIFVSVLLDQLAS